MSLSDAATASDALDSDIADRLGPAPVDASTSLAGAAPRPSSGQSRSHHKAKASGGRQPVGASQLVEPLMGALALLTLLIGLLLCGFRLEDPLVDIITLDNEKHEGEEKSEAEAIAQPLANILTRQKWFSQYGHQLVNSQDIIALAWGLMGYGTRVIPAVQERWRETRPPRGASRQDQRVSGQAAPAAANGYAAGGIQGYGAYSAD